MIGHNASPSAERPTLRFADDDAARFFELVSRAATKSYLLTSFDADSQEVFANLKDVARPATPERLTLAVEELRERVAADRRAGIRSTLYFYYAGHGEVVGGEGQVALVGGELTRSALQRTVLEGIRADTTHVIVDACYSYFLVAGRGPGGERVSFALPQRMPSATPGVGYVLSTSTATESHEWDAFQGGVFSHEVRSALVGGADANGDGAVDYHELGAFVAVANEAIPFPRFRPSVFVQPPPDDRDAVLFAPGALKEATQLTLSESHSGRVSISDHRGMPYADAHTDPTAALSISLLPPLRYEVSWAGQSYAVSTEQARRLHLESLEGEKLRVRSRREIHRAFDQIFTTPFSPQVVRGYRLRADPLALTMDAPPEMTARRGWAIGLTAGGGATFLGAMGLLVGSLLSRANADDLSGVARADRNDDISRLNTGAAVLGAVAGAAIGTALLLFVTDPEP